MEIKTMIQKSRSNLHSFGGAGSNIEQDVLIGGAIIKSGKSRILVQTCVQWKRYIAWINENISTKLYCLQVIQHIKLRIHHGAL